MRIPGFLMTTGRISAGRFSGSRGVGDVVGFHSASLAGRRNDKAEALEPGQAFDHCWAREFGPLHEQSQADRDATVGNPAAGLDDCQVDFDGIAGDARQVPAVEKNGFYPVVVSGFGPRDWHDLATFFKGSTGVAVDPVPMLVQFGRFGQNADCRSATVFLWCMAPGQRFASWQVQSFDLETENNATSLSTTRRLSPEQSGSKS